MKYALAAVAFLSMGFVSSVYADTVEGQFVSMSVYPQSYSQHSNILLRPSNGTYAQIWVFRDTGWGSPRWARRTRTGS